MLKLKITQTPDPIVAGELTVGFNEYFLGRTKGNLIIDDPELYDLHLRFLVTNDEKLLVMAASPGAQYIVGGKLLSEPVEIDKDILVNIGQTNILIEDFGFSNYDVVFNEDKFPSGSAERRILDIIEEESND